MPFNKIFTITHSYLADDYIGNKGELFYDYEKGEIRISDGITKGGITPSNAVFKTIKSISDFPEPISGVIHLQPGTTYMVEGDIDLLGNRLETDGVVTLLGTSSETSSLTSTGLDANTPLLTSRYTIPIRYITFKDVGTGFYIDDDNGANAPVAVDWAGVNFLNVTNVGEVGTVDNFIYTSGAFLGSQNLKITGELGTFGVFNSLFRGDGSALPIFDITSTATITRRFRLIYSSLVVLSSTTGFNVQAGSTIPIEGFILDTLNFSGDGTYLNGIETRDERALFVNCDGILNTTAIGQMIMKNNTTETVVSVSGDRYPVLGTTETATAINQKFTLIQDRNSLRYDSSIKRLFKVVCTFTLIAGQNNIIGVYIGKKPAGSVINTTNDRIEESEVYITTSGSRPDAASVQALVELEENDEVYVIVQNTNSTNNITVEFMNLIIERTN